MNTAFLNAANRQSEAAALRGQALIDTRSGLMSTSTDSGDTTMNRVSVLGDTLIRSGEGRTYDRARSLNFYNANLDGRALRRQKARTLRKQEGKNSK